METMAGTAMDTQVLVILGSAFGVMFATLTTLMFTSMRLHHRDNIKTRELIKQATEKFQTQLEQATEKFQTQLEQATKKLTADFDKQTSVTHGKLDKVVTSLSDTREGWHASKATSGSNCHPRQNPSQTATTAKPPSLNTTTASGPTVTLATLLLGTISQ